MARLLHSEDAGCNVLPGNMTRSRGSVVQFADTAQAAVARASALSRANKRTANPPKDFAPKTRRNKKAAAAPASGENAMDLD